MASVHSVMEPAKEVKRYNAYIVCAAARCLHSIGPRILKMKIMLINQIAVHN